MRVCGFEAGTLQREGLACSSLIRLWRASPSSNATGTHARGESSTLYVSLIALEPAGAHAGSSCMRHTPW